MNDKTLLSHERSFAAAEDYGKKEWVDVSSKNGVPAGTVMDASKIPWSENLDAYCEDEKTYPYWLGTTQVWCT